MKIMLIIVGGLLLSARPLQADRKPPTAFEKSIHDNRFLSARLILDEKIKRNPTDPDVQSCCQTLQSSLDRFRRKNEGSVGGNLYLQGYDAYAVGDSTAALKAWAMLLEISSRHQFEINPFWREEIVPLYHVLKERRDRDRQIQLKNSIEEDPLGVPFTARPDNPSKKNRPRRSFPRTKSLVQKTAPVSNLELLAKADRAVSSGQYEHALRLFQLAQQIDPDSQEIEEKIESIEDLIQ